MTQSAWKRSKEIKIWRWQIWKVWRTKQQFQFEPLNHGFGRIHDERTGIAMSQKNTISPIRAFFFLNWFFESMQLLNVELHIECLAAPKQFVMKYALPEPQYTQHGSFRGWCFLCFLMADQLFVKVELLFSLLYNDIMAQFSIAGDNAVKKTLVVTMLKDVGRTTWQRLWCIEFFIYVHQNVWPPSAKFANIIHWLKVLQHSFFFITIHLLHQFSARLTWNLEKKLIQSLFGELIWLIGVWSVLKSNFACKPTAGSTLRHCTFSIHNAIFSSSSGGIYTPIKCK